MISICHSIVAKAEIIFIVINIDDICFSILSCDKLTPTYRKEKAEKLKTYLYNLQGTKNIYLSKFKTK